MAILASARAASFQSLTGAPTLDERNAHKVISFRDANTDGAIWEHAGLATAYASGSNATLTVRGYSKTATTGAVRLQASIEKQSGQDIDADGFATAVAATATVAGTSGIYFEHSITLANADLDTIAAGDGFRIKIERLGSDGADTLTEDYQLSSWLITQ